MVKRRRQQDHEVEMNEPWLKILAKWGPITMIALYMVQQLNGEVKTTLNQIVQNMNDTKAALGAHTDSTSGVAWNLQALVNIQLQGCINDADTRAERDSCFRAQYEKPKQEER